MRIPTISLLTFLAMHLSWSQPGWNWPADGELKTKALEKQAYYKVLMAQSKYGEAVQALNWLYENNPDLNPSIYIDGVKCLSNIAKKSNDKIRKQRIQDSVLWMYDQRMVYFDSDASVADRKAYEAFKFYYKTPSRYPMLLDLYAQAYDMNGSDISDFNLNIYMMLATNSHKANAAVMPAEKVLDIHSEITSIIEEKFASGGNKERLKKEQDKVDGFLASIENILNCDYIEKSLVSKFRSSPSDIGTAKKIFRYSVKAGCTDQDYFLEASETVYEHQPSFNLASAIGKKYLGSKDYQKALEFYREALKKASTDTEKYEAFVGQAIVAGKLGRKAGARSLAYKALSVKPGGQEACNLIGNLYFTSFNECQGGESKVIDRGVFIAAYKMYQRAGNSSQMQAAKEQFPSIEEIFSEGYEEGESITIGCWINETVTIERRHVN